MKQQYCKYWEQIMSAAQLKAQVKGGCHCCAYVLGGDAAHLEMHCGYDYFQQPVKERKVVKLSCFPAVDADYVCPRWHAKKAG